MALLETWRNLAYGDGLNDKDREKLWSGYFQIEKGIYEKLLSDPAQVVEGTVKELAEKYGTELLIMTGFLDGINESLKGYQNPIDTMEEDTQVKIEIDPERLYYNMVEAKADWLYNLPMWDDILTEEKRKELYKAQKASGTVVKGPKIGRNDPCPCGSGKKYKTAENGGSGLWAGIPASLSSAQTARREKKSRRPGSPALFGYRKNPAVG